jgi:biotin synthase
MNDLLNKLYEENNLSGKELLYILDNINEDFKTELFRLSRLTKEKYYGNKIYIRGLIEFSNYCKNSCKYCGLRKQNKTVDRYRLSKKEILQCCERGYNMGIKTFVMQSGEEESLDQNLLEISAEIKKLFPDTAITFSIGEKSKNYYEELHKAGVDRFLLRHETANKDLYDKLHPGMSYENRRSCLKSLKEIGFQTGSGFIVGLPEQSNEILVEDLMFLKNLNPEMVGVGPFIPHINTPLKSYTTGSSEKTLTCLAITRLLLPKVLLPATTALSVIDSRGYEKALKAGANVIMINISPSSAKTKYEIYNGKSNVLDNIESLNNITRIIKNEGLEIEISRGDYFGRQL